MTPSTCFDVIRPDWSAPSNIVAGVTTRQIGQSSSPYDCGNLGLHVGDDERVVLANRQALARQLALSRFSWLDQIHGTKVVAASENLQTADAVYTHEQGLACAVMTADCLPLLLCNTQGTEVAALHCGWRSLAGGIVDKTIARLSSNSVDLIAWMGPAIGPAQFEVGQDVADAFAQQPWAKPECFTPINEGKYLADIYALCRFALADAGVVRVSGGDMCTVTQSDLFYSYRREGITGRMAAVIAITRSHGVLT